jgi:hypothetical protein
VNIGLRIAFVVVLELPQIGHRMDAKAGSDNRSVVLEPVGEAGAGIEVALIELPEAGWQAFLAV